MTEFVPQDWLSKELNKLKNKDSEVDFSKYKEDPELFFREILGIKELWAKQIRIAELLNNNKRISVKSAHKTGKSFICSAIALWWICTKPKSSVVILAPTHRQVRNVIWKEISYLFNSSKYPIEAELNRSPDTGLRFEDGRFIQGFATDNAIKLQGYSGANLLFILDEASGIPDEVYKAVRANLAGGAKVLAIGNPNFPLGFFYDSFQEGNKAWTNLHISAMDAAPYANKIPGLAEWDWIDQMYIEEGENSPEYQIRVLGEFPSFGSEQLFGIQLLDSSIKLHNEVDQSNSRSNSQLRIGIDVSRTGEGDPTIIQAVRGNYAYNPIAIPGSDGKSLAESIINVIKGFLLGSEQIKDCIINIDSIGIGASPVDFLREMKIKVNDINVGMNANDSQYFNLRSEAYMNMRKWIENGGMIPPDEKLKKDLLAHSYNIDEKGRIKLEKKDKVKLKLSGRSPDRSDALSLALINQNKNKNKGIKHISLGKSRTSSLKKEGI